MADLYLPEELQSFLKNESQLQYDASSIEPGRVGLSKLSELELGVVWVNSDDSPLQQDDPNTGEEGYYEVPAVSLTNECEAYDPEFILLWLPNEKLFGSWDCDHWDLHVFPGATWDDIVADPAKYIDTQWSADEGGSSEYFKPYPNYPFQLGEPE